jgi:hypothetical protein
MKIIGSAIASGEFMCLFRHSVSLGSAINRSAESPAIGTFNPQAANGDIA